jgi:hypothetical protein
MAQLPKPRKEDPLKSGDVDPVAVPERPAKPAVPAHEIAGVPPPGGRPDSPDAENS